MHPSRVVTLVGTGAAAAALLLPQARFPTIGQVDGIEGAAWPVLLPLAPIALLALIGDRAEGHRPGLGVVAVLLSCAAVVFAAAKAADAVLAVRRVQGAAVGVGTWMVLGAVVAVLVGSLLSLSRRLR